MAASLRKGLLILICLAGLLAGCARAQPFPAPPTATPSRTASRLYALTLTPRPTRTPGPSDTPLPPTRTFEPTWTLSKSTRNALLTITPLVLACNKYGEWDLSPDGSWLAQSCLPEPGVYPYDLLVTWIATGKTCRVHYDSPPDGGDGRFVYVSPAHWSPDGRTLYVEISDHVDSVSYVYPDTSALWRLDLQSCQVTDILPQDHRLWTFSFSPGNRLAYFLPGDTPDSDELVVLDLQTLVSRQIRIWGYRLFGYFLWSPSEDRLVMLAAVDDSKKGGYYYFYVLVDLNQGTYREVLGPLERPPAPLAWQGQFPIYIQREYSLHGSDRCFILDLEKNALNPTACP